MPKLRVGIIGAGGRGINSFGHTFTKVHADVAEIAALADPNPVRAQAGLDILGIKADIVDNAHDMVKRKDIDIVIVTSPDYLHEEHAVAALKAGKHVLVDKPLATSVDGCMRILEAADAAGKILYMGFNLRHHAVVRNLRQMAQRGEFGDIFSIIAMEYYNGGRTYHSRWNRLKKFTGGLWLHKGSHDFDVINYIMGGVRPARVSCFANVFTFKPERLPFKTRKGVKPGPTCSACPYKKECPDAYMTADTETGGKPRMFGEEAAKVDGYHKNLCMYLSDKDTHDQGVAIVEYANGATATHTECFATPISNRRYFVDGTLGHGEADLHASKIEFRPRWTKDVKTHEIAQEEGGHGGADPLMVQNFLDCIRKRAKPIANAADGAWSVAIACAAEMSREKGQVIEIAKIMDVKSRLLA